MSVIATLRGEVIDRDASFDKPSGEVIVEVGGVGYRLTVTAATMSGLTLGDAALLHVHHHFWEADEKLFGFLAKDERIAFEGLLAAHKVGPALALAIIATHPPAHLARVLATDDIDALCDVPGVGKKTAQRLLVDLKSTLVLPVLDTETGEALPAGGPPPAAEAGPLADVRSALQELGYGSEEIKTAMAALRTEDASEDSGVLLKRALRSLAGG